MSPRFDINSPRPFDGDASSHSLRQSAQQPNRTAMMSAELQAFLDGVIGSSDFPSAPLLPLQPDSKMNQLVAYNPMLDDFLNASLTLSTVTAAAMNTVGSGATSGQTETTHLPSQTVQPVTTRSIESTQPIAAEAKRPQREKRKAETPPTPQAEDAWKALSKQERGKASTVNCRIKKKQYIRELKAQVEKLETLTQSHTTQIQRLQDENTQLREQLTQLRQLFNYEQRQHNSSVASYLQYNAHGQSQAQNSLFSGPHPKGTPHQTPAQANGLKYRR